jgi:type VI secretion system FHA domain protein
MALTVTVKDLQPGGTTRQVALPEPRATIGRNATCDLVLQDPEKHVSRLHATIELRQQVHYLTVNSSINPILVDGAACEPNTTVALRDGACIGMHPFEVTVRIESGAAPARGGDSFSWVEGGQRTTATADADPFGLNYAKATAAVAPVAPMPDMFQRQAESSSLVTGMSDCVHGVGAPPGLDPLALLGGSLDAPPAQHLSLESLLGGGAAGGPSSALVDFGGHLHRGGASAVDHVHDFNLPFNAPPAGEPVAVSSRGLNLNDSALDWLDELVPGQRAAPVAAPAAVPLPEPVPAQSTAVAPVALAATATATATAGGDAMQAFLRGLGDVGLTIAPEQQAEFFENAGAVAQVIVKGLLTLMLARGEIKKELRAEERTMLASRANNPLKFMGTPQEAARFLFDPAAARAGAFLAPATAIEEACGELVAHELGLVAGMRAAVIGAIKRFDPAALELKAGKGGGLIAMSRKARLWEMYVEQYGQLENDMADNLDRLFERDFLGAYTEQVRRMGQK